MSTKVIIVLEIEGDVGSAHQVVEGALDAGVIQDLIAAHEHDGEPFTIVSATARADAMDEDEPAPLAPVVANPPPCPLRQGWTFDSVRDDGSEVQFDEEAELFDTDLAARAHIRACSFCLMDLMAEADGLPVEALLDWPGRAIDEGSAT